MSWILSLVIGLLTAVLGCFGAGYVASLWVSWYRISSFEGASGYYVGFIALLGAVVGLIIGVVASRWVPGSEGAPLGKGLLYASGALAGLLLVVTAVSWLAADIRPKQSGRPLEIVAEIRTPVGFKLPVVLDQRRDYARVEIPGGRSQPSAALDLRDAQSLDGRWIIPVAVPLDTSRSDLFFRVVFDESRSVLFPLRVKGRPTDANAWSGWVDAARDAGEVQPAPDQRFSFRYRVVVVPPPPPPPSAAEVATEKERKEQAEFAAIPPDAPIPAWLPYLGYGVPDERRQAAIARIVSRPDFLAEFTALIVAPEPDIASAVLRMVEGLPAPTPELNAPVARAGRKIVTLLQKVNATPVTEDPSHLGAAEVSVRFSAWMTAVRTLRAKAGGDFTPELKEILELARVRTESHALRMDVVRVASFYLHEWTGLAPLPSDPPPR